MGRDHPFHVWFEKEITFKTLDEASSKKENTDDLYEHLKRKGGWEDIDPRLSAKDISDTEWLWKSLDENIIPDEINNLCDICDRRVFCVVRKKFKKEKGLNYCTHFVKQRNLTDEYVAKMNILLKLRGEVIYIPGKGGFNLVL